MGSVVREIPSPAGRLRLVESGGGYAIEVPSTGVKFPVAAHGATLWLARDDPKVWLFLGRVEVGKQTNHVAVSLRPTEGPSMSLSDRPQNGFWAVAWEMNDTSVTLRVEWSLHGRRVDSYEADLASLSDFLGPPAVTEAGVGYGPILDQATRE